MDRTDARDVVVIGAGIAGLSVAIWARRLGLSALILEMAKQPGGQLLALSQPVRDYPGVPERRGPELAAVLEQQALALGAELRVGSAVSRVDVRSRTCFAGGGAVSGRALVLATGLSPRRLGVPGEEEIGRHGLVRRPSVEPDWFRGRRVAVIGGGDRAAENALLLGGAGAAEVFLIHRGEELRVGERFGRPLRALPGLELLLQTCVRAFTVSSGGVMLDLSRPGRDSQLSADAICIYIGNQPNTGLVRGQVALSPDGYLVTDGTGESSVPGFYGVGDICTPAEFQSLIGAAGQAAAVAKRIAVRLA